MMKENTRIIFQVGALIAIILLTIFSSAFYLARWQCESYGEETGRETKFVGLCYVKQGGAWFTISEFKYVQLMEKKQCNN